MILEAIFNGQIYPAETVVPKQQRQAKRFQQPDEIMWRFGLICGQNVGSVPDVLTAIPCKRISYHPAPNVRK